MMLTIGTESQALARRLRQVCGALNLGRSTMDGYVR